MGLDPSITHETGLKALYEKLEEKVEKKIPSSDFVNMAKFVLKNNYLKSDSKVKKQISGIAMGINLLLLTNIPLWIRWKENSLKPKI